MNNNEGNSTESTGIHRRTIVKGAAWSIPVIAAAVAAPNATASTTAPCPTGVVDWTSYTRNSATSASGNAILSDGTLIPFTITETYGPNIRPVAENLTLDGQYGRLLHSGVPQARTPDFTYNDRWTMYMQITFANPVSNLSFRIGDIEWQASREFVGVTASGSGVAASPSSGIALFRQGQYAQTTNGTSAGYVDYTVPGPTSSITLAYTRIKSTNPQYEGGVNVSRMNFDAVC